MSVSYLKKCQDKIKNNYGVRLDEESYQETLLKSIESDEKLHNYFKGYIEKNRNKLSLSWAVFMYLFIKASEKKDVTLVQKYYKELKKYPSNYYIEYVLGDIELMYYGNLFESKDRFLKALKLKEEDAKCYCNLGFIYNLLGVFETSLEYYNKAIYYSKNSDVLKKIRLRALYNIGVHYITVEKDIKKAEEVFQSILKEEPDNIKVLETLKKLKGGI